MSFQSILQQAEELSQQFSQRTAKFDEEQHFPFKNFEELKAKDFQALTIPVHYGGHGLNLLEFLSVQERIAKGDSATALCLGWHLGSLLEIAENGSWNADRFQELCETIVDRKSLINRAATEPATGSPTRGGMPQTTAVQQGETWLLNGRKSFTSMAVALDYSLVTARIGDTDQKGVFLVDHSLEGVSIEETWSMISMQGTRSDDLLLNNVSVPSHFLVEEEGDQTNYSFPKAWLLHIPACYLGIAGAAREYAIEFAKTYSPNSLPGPIKDVPEVQRKVGEMELEYYKCKQMLYAVAEKWVSFPEERPKMGAELAAVKHIVTNGANKIVDIAMRIVGAKSLSKDNPLQRYFRDVRAGLHNPPMDDSVISVLAKKVLY
ncbi:acyl-CoA dehydrogenase family protein [Fictibacillus phosphorivorans]|uniref:acyl-CoA dehydrogenase family protein n=1 Tax=Fictibacillus phosphorivorans TaxID=1221500 RepID=UPI00203D310C|nr:acyl-CoA dehydrogenase family protein [Fictibacillus phosphorivorans]MCM3720296.1 acyl-CoA/acyl-ACP dehydrogenase [Fictibacillus phosphorivorans]MCM3777986.1 acyl-CoA/acyl-ACP dehydrogenase [Fictibacillus phosphorivorans]